jgi:hypothetical protein
LNAIGKKCIFFLQFHCFWIRSAGKPNQYESGTAKIFRTVFFDKFTEFFFLLVGKRKVPGFPQRITTGCAIAAGSPPTASAVAAPSASLSGVQDAESSVAAAPVDSSATEQALELHDGGRMTTTRTVVAMNPTADTGNSYDYRDDGDTHLYRISFMI